MNIASAIQLIGMEVPYTPQLQLHLHLKEHYAPYPMTVSPNGKVQFIPGLSLNAC